MSERNFFSELKRRNVFRAAAFYAASAWLLVQVATQVFPFFHIAEWVVRWVVVAAIIGFPFALLFSWFYEWTPKGLKLDSFLCSADNDQDKLGHDVYKHNLLFAPNKRLALSYVSDGDLLKFFHSMGFVRGPFVELQKSL